MYSLLTVRSLPAWVNNATVLCTEAQREVDLKASPSQSDRPGLDVTELTRILAPYPLPCAASSTDLKQGPFGKGKGGPRIVVLDFLELSMFPA